MYLSEETKKVISENESNIKKGGENFSNVELFGKVMLMDFFLNNNIFSESSEIYKISEIKKKLNLVEKHEQLFSKLLDILKREEIISVNDDLISVSNMEKFQYITGLSKKLDNFRDNMIEKYEDMRPNFALLETCIKNYTDIFSGNTTANAVMFPMFSTELVQGVFKGNRLVDYFNILIADIIYDFIKSNPGKNIRILEIGSGTGGTSEFVMEKIKDFSDVEFYFTDISKIFLKKAQTRFSEKYPFVKFEKLDVEVDLEGQGFTSDSFDIIFASNVIHATSNIRAGVSNIHKLMKSKGVFLLNELTAVQDFATLTFGLMDGWWKFEDRDLRLPGSPLLNIDGWKKLLESYSFNDINIVSTSETDKKECFSQTLFYSSKD